MKPIAVTFRVTERFHLQEKISVMIEDSQHLCSTLCLCIQTTYLTENVTRTLCLLLNLAPRPFLRQGEGEKSPGNEVVCCFVSREHAQQDG